MPSQFIPYKDTGYFSKLICDYLDENTAIKPFYNRFPSLENFELQIEEKRKTFTKAQRQLLAKRIMLQYGYNSMSQATLSNIDLLKENNTFTITTGHQLNLFTGPLYFLCKIYSVINLCEQLKEKYPNFHFTPIYWMATEDHDFEEINFFNLYNKKMEWKRESFGGVGELSTEGLENVKRQIQQVFGESNNGKALTSLFTEAYLKHDNLADATRYLANQLFHEQGLVIVDGNDPELKKCFIPYAERELKENLSYKEVTKTTKKLVAQGFAEQVHPREINLFYLQENLRERIIERDGTFYINDTDITFTKEEIIKKLHENPERFSPNALLRPLYEEVILPNLCYIGGGGELAYWFQLKEYFKEEKVPFPILLLRNSALIVTGKQEKKRENLGISRSELFLKQHELINRKVRKISNIDIDFSKQKQHLVEQFREMYKLAEQTDVTFLNAVKAQEVKQLKGLDHLEKRLLKAQKRKLKEILDRVVLL